ncbi:hypothetical protein JOM56_010292 [Amanita muscaria]
MHLYLTGDYRNCSYVNADGQVIYVVETSNSGRFKTVSTVKRTNGKDGPVSSNNNFTDVGEIAFNPPTSLIQLDGASIHLHSSIRLGGREYETSRFFSKVGLKNDLGFTGPDGADYKWRLRNKALQLVRRNADKTPIALFHPKIIGWPRKPRPVSLEIFSEETVDLIVVTYIFAQKECDSRRAKAQTSPMVTSAPGFLNGITVVARGEALQDR